MDKLCVTYPRLRWSRICLEHSNKISVVFLRNVPKSQWVQRHLTQHLICKTCMTTVRVLNGIWTGLAFLLPPLITTRSQEFLFHVHFNNFPNTVQSLRFQGGCERNQGRKISCHVLQHLCYSIFSSPTGFSEAIPHCSKVLSYILYDGPITQHWIGQEFSLEGKGETNAMLLIYHGRQG